MAAAILALACYETLGARAGGRADTRAVAHLIVGRALASHPASATVTMPLTHWKEATP